MNHPSFAGLHFTGSTRTFNLLWNTIGQNLVRKSICFPFFSFSSTHSLIYHHQNKYRSYPRIVGETGGKNFHFVHESADLENVAYNTVRSAFEV
jgi:1-pyrroline-5-carboxylate dehydrogenase